MSQTINGYYVQFLDDGNTSPDWKRTPMIQPLTLAGTGITEDHLLGYGQWVLAVSLDIVGNGDDGAAHRALRALAGQTVTITGWDDPDENDPFTARLAAYDVRPLRGGAAGYTGSIELRKSGNV